MKSKESAKKPLVPVYLSDVFRAFWQGMRPNIPSFLVAFGGMLVGEVIILFVPIYYGALIDTVTGGTSDLAARAALLPHLLGVLIGIFIIRLIYWVAYRVNGFAENHYSTRTIARLKQQAFEKMMTHSQSFFSNSFTGSLTQRVNRFASAFDRISDRVIWDISPIIIKIVGVATAAWFVSPMLSWAIIIWSIVFLGYNYVFSRWKSKYDFARAESDSRTTAVLADSITNNSAILLNNGLPREEARFREVSDEQGRLSRFAWNLSTISSAFQSALIIGMEIGLVWYEIKLWQQGLITAGTFTMIQIYFASLSSQIFGFARVVRDLYESYADAKEMVEIMRLPEEIKDAPGARALAIKEGGIEFKDVQFGFGEGGRDVLKKISIAIKPGEKIALVGPSGAGKSTFVRLLLRFYDVTGGSISIDGQDIRSITKQSLYDALSLVPQDPILFHRSLAENIRYGAPKASDEEVYAAARMAHCDEFISSLPLKYETLVGERGIKLSGGERQRVAIARAILRNAPILILDEATSSLDSHSEALIQDALEKLMASKTVIVVAHRLSTIRKMDRIVVIDQGSILEQGSHEELTAKEGSMYRKLWELQAGGFVKNDDE